MPRSQKWNMPKSAAIIITKLKTAITSSPPVNVLTIVLLAVDVGKIYSQEEEAKAKGSVPDGADPCAFCGAEKAQFI